jgi:hypothetical protein
MILLRLSVFMLGAGIQMQPQSTAVAPAPAPVTEVMAMTSLKPGVALPDVMKLVQEEVRVAVQLYLEGKVDRWYTRGDGKGAVLFLRCRTAEEGRVIMADLPLVKAGYLNVEYIPVGPFSGLRNLVRPEPAADGAGPH